MIMSIIAGIGLYLSLGLITLYHWRQKVIIRWSDIVPIIMFWYIYLPVLVIKEFHEKID